MTCTCTDYHMADCSLLAPSVMEYDIDDFYGMHDYWSDDEE